ncbi:MAG: ABC transporter permease [Myxococcales bacterium]|nr:ABC transporter permease [Myxococcales bacterium]
MEGLLLPLLGIGGGLAVWHAAVVWSSTRVFPSPLAVASGIGELARRGVLPGYIASSLLRVAVGYGLAALAGIPLGTVMGRYRSAGTALNPVVQLLRPISPLAWIPIAILTLGVGDGAAIFLIFLGAFFPIVFATMNGVIAVPAMYVQAGENFGLSAGALLWRVILPAALPQVLSGLRIALGIAWIVVVAAEMLAVDSGLGYLIIDARNAGKRYDLVVAGMVLIGTIGLALDRLMRRLERLRSVRWGFHNE